MRKLPAEWHPQSAVLIAWPNLETDWKDTIKEAIECYKRIAKAISKDQKLIVLADDPDRVKGELGEVMNERIILHETKYNDTWTRDYGPITVIENDELKLLDFKFNGWGEKFDATMDNLVVQYLHQNLLKNIDLESHGEFVLEGGSIESDGQGTILTTSHCLMAQNRNQPLNRKQIENYLKEHLGAERVLWLDYGWLEGDDTDGHIDTLARFCDDETIAYVKCENHSDKHFYDLMDMENEIKNFRKPDGKPYELVPLPMPEAIYDSEGKRLPATYANFLIMNDKVLLPFYNCPQDKLALQQLSAAFPDREVIGVDCLPLIRQHGSLHCVTMQLPEGVI